MLRVDFFAMSVDGGSRHADKEMGDGQGVRGVISQGTLMRDGDGSDDIRACS